MARRELTPGARLGNYRIVEVLGRGGMGVVYKAHDEPLDRPVAIKLLLPELANDAAVVRRFEREAQTAARIAHPNIATVYAVSAVNDTPYLVSQFVPGGTLAGKVSREGPLPWRDAALRGAEIARALEALHLAGLVHRDLKPANVLLDEAGHAKLTDFGLARTVSSSSKLTKTGELLGTLEYLAPEQAGGEADLRSDLYALGATIFTLLTGRPPFEGSGFVLLRKHLTERPRPPSALVPGIPEDLERLVLRLLAKTPDERGTAADTAAALESIVQGRTASPDASREDSRPRRRVLLALVGVVAVASAVVASRSAPGPSKRDPDPGEKPTHVAPPPPRRAGPRPPHGSTKQPPWFPSRPDDAYPPLPLPKGLTFGKGRGEYVNEADGSVLVYVPAGAFPMSGAEGPVEVPAYFIGKYEVTNALFRAFLDETGYVPTEAVERLRGPSGGDVLTPDTIYWMRNPRASWLDPEGEGKGQPPDEHPVVQVSWEDATAYCRWASLRLPNEAQWEKAAAWDPAMYKERVYAWGDEFPGRDTKHYANLRDEAFRRVRGECLIFEGYNDSFPGLAPVGSFPDGASAYGALDMIGNAAEWCEDARVGKEPPQSVSERPNRLSDRAIRGGDFTVLPPFISTTVLGHADAAHRACGLGFRVARPATPEPTTYDDATPFTAPVGLDFAGHVHPAIVDAYKALGPERVGLPFTTGGGVRVHAWDDNLKTLIDEIQDFVRPDCTCGCIMHKPGNAKAFFVRGEAWGCFIQNDGQRCLGNATSEETADGQDFERGRLVHVNGTWKLALR